MKSHTVKNSNVLDRVRPLTDQHEAEIQPYGTIAKLPIGLAERACKASVENLNQLLADTICLRDMYKKTTGRWSDRPSINSICCTTNTIRSRVNL